ncbi:MAG: hypothetical protein JWR89_1005 [Tardiphaga sp.]|jgi:hypothetical protein|uniref:hypothetical protein n=1 Tax=Tardiphaga sp. TaxID=1926292 RepID=UPI0026226C86|nr:hypothetical protein [Tardiphaga sp.]MDB5501103.1 hypothetical protein [Tardiphaga sp.]
MTDRKAAPDWRDHMISRHPTLFGGPSDYRSGRPETGDGWRDLLETAVERLAYAMQAAPNATLRIDQVKTKFGTLRFYASGTFAADPDARCAVELAIDLAEARSATTCESCGDEGRLYESIGGWLATACPLHADGTAVPLRPERAGLVIRRRYIDNKLELVSCRRYVRSTDSFVDVDPAEVGIEE